MLLGMQILSLSLQGFLLPIYVIFRTICGDLQLLQLATALNRFLQKKTSKNVVQVKDVPFGGPDHHN